MVHPAVMIVLLLDDGRLVLERQSCYPVARALLEFPAGNPTDVRESEATLVCAQRELAIQPKLPARSLCAACCVQRSAYSTGRYRDLVRARPERGDRRLDDGEFIGCLADRRERHVWLVNS